MFLRNTGPFPTEEVRELVEFASRGVNMKRVCVNVKGTSYEYKGHAYDGIPGISNAPPTARYLVTVGVPDNNGYPMSSLPENWHGRYYERQLQDWREVMVWVAAHEARHIHQYRHGKRRSEIDAEKFAAKALDRFRQSTQN